MDNKRLKICQQCVFKKEDINRGVLCSLTGRQPNFIGNCNSYKENTLIVKDNNSFFNFDNKKSSKKEEQASQQTVRTFKTVKTTSSYTRSKSSSNGKIAWKLLIFLFILFKVVSIVSRLSNHARKREQIKTYTIDNEQRKKKRQERNAKRYLIRQRKEAIKLMVPQDRLQDKKVYLENDTTFMLANKIKITLNQQYYLSTKKNDELPLYATARNYTFTYNKVKKDKHKTIKEQWLDYRKQLNSSIVIKNDYIDKKDQIPVEKIKFYFGGTYKTYGAAKLIEIGNTRYFFQFTYLNDTEKYGQLQRYLNYYVRVAKK